MKKLSAVFISMVLIMFFVTSINASEKTTYRTRQITGKVSDVNATDNTITVKKKGMEVVLNMDSKTKVAECTNNATIANIKTGDKVTASYKEMEESNMAKSITVTKK